MNYSRKHGKLLPSKEFEANVLARRFSANTGLQSVFAIAEGCHGNIWFGDKDTGAWRYDGETLVNLIVDEKLGSQIIWDIYEDQNLFLRWGKVVFTNSTVAHSLKDFDCHF